MDLQSQNNSMSQFNLFTTETLPPVAITPTILEHVYNNAPVAIGVSGGKDSGAAAWATVNFLDSVGHTGPRLLIHADLGSTEWPDSLPTCQDLATRLGLELVVVKRQKGDMLQRWQQRWNDNLKRYANLECVKLILPWSTSKMRFCTSELKTQVICRYLAKRFKGQTILNVTGIRRAESTDRKNKPVEAINKYLIKPDHNTYGYDWNSIVDWAELDVWTCHRVNNIRIHEAYTKYRAKRVSCMFCMLGDKGTQLAATRCSAGPPLLRAQVDLEIESTFSFQGRWLADLKPELLTPIQRERVAHAKKMAEKRELLEALIPKHLHYKKGWPESMPTQEEAELLAKVRNGVADAIGVKIGYTTAESIINRYAELILLKDYKTPIKPKAKKLCK